MMQMNRDAYVNTIFTKAAPHIDFLSSLLSFGIADLWRKKLVTLAGLGEGDRALDLCTGTGKLAVLIADRIGTTGSITGIDFCDPMLNKARKKAAHTGRSISFILENAKELSFADCSFDVVTVAFGMRNIQDTLPALKETYRVLRQGGRFICLELTTPTSRWFQPMNLTPISPARSRSFRLQRSSVRSWSRVVLSTLPFKA
jgi:demethylmenaquinone methyltransferase/2-methoxy-6-polyprenyl-1,4-benzoquinol methylase